MLETFADWSVLDSKAKVNGYPPLLTILVG
jgi:hypothetical protein